MPLETPRKLSLLETKEILAINRDEIDLDLMREMFACTMGQNKPKYQTYDEIVIPAGTEFNGWQTPTAIKSTVGRVILNKFIFPTKYLKKYGYVNEPLTKKSVGKIEEKLGDMVINDEMTTQEFTDYLDRAEWLAMGVEYFLVPSLDYEFNNPIPEVIAKRDELFEKYKDKIKASDSATIAMIEKELTSMAKDIIKKKKNESYDFYESGTADFGNHYKKTSIMNGAVLNPYTGKVAVIKNNLIDGLTPEEFPEFAQLVTQGGMARGVDTQLSGYERKKLDNAMQAITVDDKGTDCGTPYYLEFTIPDSKKDLFLYRYVIENDPKNPTLITRDNLSKFVGKKVKLRSPMFCKGDTICNKCAGELFYKLGIKNAGLVNSNMAGKFLNICMKKFHDATVHFIDIDPEKFIKKH